MLLCWPGGPKAQDTPWRYEGMEMRLFACMGLSLLPMGVTVAAAVTVLSFSAQAPVPHFLRLRSAHPLRLTELKLQEIEP